MNKAVAEYREIPLPPGVHWKGVSGPAGAFFMSLTGGWVYARGAWHDAAFAAQPPRFCVAVPDGFLLMQPTGPTFKVSLSGQVEELETAAGGPVERLANPAEGWDPEGNRALLFGGTYFEKGKQKDESAVWSWAGGKWQPVKTSGKVTPRSAAMAAWVPALRSLVVLGGHNDRKGFQAETLHLHGKQWTVFETAGEASPAYMMGRFLAWDAASSQLICGVKSRALGELWLYRYLGAGRWEQLAVVESYEDSPTAAFDGEGRQLVTVANGEPGKPKRYAVVPLGPWLDALPKVEWASESVPETAGKAPATAATPAVPEVPKETYLRFREDDSDKFWFATLEGSSYTLRWGKRGTAGQSKTFTLDSAEKTAKELGKKIKAKLDDGYEHAPEGAAAAEVPGRRAFAMTFTDEATEGADWIYGAPAASVTWPSCSHCTKRMKHLATFHAHPERLPLAKHQAVAVFQCATASCPAWQPGSGANAVLGVGGVGAAALEGETVQSAQSIRYATAVLERAPDEDSDEPDPSGSKLGGYPTWVHGPPDAAELTCGDCKKELRFVGQLDAGDTGMNFGDVGLGYVFFCADGCGGRFVAQG